MAKELKVLFLIFPRYNTLDLNGPAEVLGHREVVGSSGITFKTTIASATEYTTAYENVTVKRDVCFTELLKHDAKQLAEFDLLIQPGGPKTSVDASITSKSGILDVIDTFAKQQRPGGKPQRWLVSICTGALFLGTLGLFADKTVTTHFGTIKDLQEICDKLNEGGDHKTVVVRQRWVDAERLPSATRLVTSGGVSCGIDCTLYVLAEIAGMDTARRLATTMDYDWGFGGVKATQGWIIPAQAADKPAE